MKQTIILLMGIFFCVQTQICSAQSEARTLKFPLKISVFSHSISMPFSKIIKSPLQFGIAIGTSWTYNKQDKNNIGQNLDIGWYFHKELGQGIFTKSNVFYRYTSPKGLYGEVGLGGGYLHTFHANDIYTLDNEGTYQATKDKGNGSFIGGFSLSSGYHLASKGNISISPFLKYEWLLQYPYSDFTPIFPHSLFHIGAAIDW